VSTETVAREQNYPYPLIVMDGQLRFVGTAECYVLAPLVEESLAAQEAAVE